MRNAADPIFTNHQVSVPFGCSPDEIEAALLKFVVDLVVYFEGNAFLQFLHTEPPVSLYLNFILNFLTFVLLYIL